MDSNQDVNEDDVVVGVDIGASKIIVIIGALQENGSVRCLGFGNQALKLGSNTDLQTTVEALQKAIHDAEVMTGIDVKNVYLGVGGESLRVIPGNGETLVDSGEVTAGDIENVERSAVSFVQTSTFEIVHKFNVNYKLDNQQEPYKNPLGMSCAKLSATVNVVTAPKNVIENAKKCVSLTNHGIESCVLESYAAGLAVLTEDEKELGVAVLDIGAQSTDLAIFKDDSIWFTASLPAGGLNITSDITRAFQVPIAMARAEEIKKTNGTCVINNLIGDDTIAVPGIGDRGDVPCSRKLLTSVIRERLKQIFQLYADYMERHKLLDSLNGGIVLTGGTSSIEGIAQLAEEVFKVPVRCGKPKPTSGLLDAFSNPGYATGIGLLEYAALMSKGQKRGTRKAPIVDMTKSFGQRVVDFFKTMKP